MKPGIQNQDKSAPVALCKLGENHQGVREAVELCGGLNDLDPNMSVLIKPNLVVWLEKFAYAPYGVITSSAVVEEVIKILKDKGVKSITVGDGCAQNKDFGSTTQKLFDGFNYHTLEKKYGVKLVDFNAGKHEKMSFGPHTLKVAQTVIESEYINTLPAIKTHEGTRITLGFKNMKGSLSVKSKQSCHNPNHAVDEYLVYLAEQFYPNLTIIDGTYMLEAGPMFTGTAHRAELIVAGRDMFSGGLGPLCQQLDIIKWLPLVGRHDQQHGGRKYICAARANPDGKWQVKPLKVLLDKRSGFSSVFAVRGVDVDLPDMISKGKPLDVYIGHIGAPPVARGKIRQMLDITNGNTEQGGAHHIHGQEKDRRPRQGIKTHCPGTA